MKNKFLMIVFGMLLLSQFAAADALVSVGLVTANNNAPANVNVTISGATNLYGFQFDVFFDTNGLQITGDTAGSLFTVPGGFTSISSPAIDNIGGSYTNAGYVFFGSDGVVGNGVLLTLNFNTTNALGFSFVNIDNVILLDTNLDPISFTTQSGGVTATPEPGSLILLGSGLVGMAGTLRRRIGC